MSSGYIIVLRVGSSSVWLFGLGHPVLQGWFVPWLHSGGRFRFESTYTSVNALSSGFRHIPFNYERSKYLYSFQRLVFTYREVGKIEAKIEAIG